MFKSLKIGLNTRVLTILPKTCTAKNLSSYVTCSHVICNHGICSSDQPGPRPKFMHRPTIGPGKIYFFTNFNFNIFSFISKLESNNTELES